MRNSTPNWMNGPKAFGSIFSQDVLEPARAISPIRKCGYPAVMQAILEKPTPIQQFENIEEHEMKQEKNGTTRVLAIASLAAGLVIAGCNSNPKYPDSKEAVNNSLTQNNLGAIHVSQDQDKGVITLTGTVPSDGQKTQAESVAKQAAPNYTIADEIAVVPPQNADATKAAISDTDDAIEDNFKADLKKHRSLDDQDISVKAKDGALVLTGSVKTEAQKREAERLAKHVPNVQQVVNEIEVKPGKHSSAS